MRRCSLQRLKSEDRERVGRPRTGLFTAKAQPVFASDRRVRAVETGLVSSAGVPSIFSDSVGNLLYGRPSFRSYLLCRTVERIA